MDKPKKIVKKRVWLILYKDGCVAAQSICKPRMTESMRDIKDIGEQEFNDNGVECYVHLQGVEMKLNEIMWAYVWDRGPLKDTICDNNGKPMIYAKKRFLQAGSRYLWANFPQVMPDISAAKIIIKEVK